MSDFTAANLFNVKDLVFVITGGGSGLGEWMALALDQNGASKVFVLGRRLDSLEKVATKATNKSLIPVQCDISSKVSLKAAVDTISQQTPFINVLIGNGGTKGPLSNYPLRPASASLASIQSTWFALPSDEVHSMYDTNVLGTFNTFVAFVQLLEAGNTHASSRGKIDHMQSQFIVISSISAFEKSESVSHFYAMAKAGLVHLTKMLAAQFAQEGIRVNCIAPGLFVTEMTEFAIPAETRRPGSFPADSIPATRSGTPEDIAGAVLYLTSKAGEYVNGIVLLLSGGAHVTGGHTY